MPSFKGVEQDMQVPVKTIALTQLHRGLGVSTAAFYLGQTLVQQQYPVLLANITGRGTHAQKLDEQFRMHKLVLWQGNPPQPRQLGTLVNRARQDVNGKASCVILDCDGALIQSAVEEEPGIDYLLIAIDPVPEEIIAADRLARAYERLLERNKVGIVFMRVATNRDDDIHIPEKTDENVPVLSVLPADYRLAMNDDRNGPLMTPNQPYLSGIMRLSTRLTRLVPLMTL